MNHIIGKNRQQINMSTLEDFISPENPVRFFDAFVDKLDLNELQFKVITLKTEGRPAFESKLFLKIYLYGYFFEHMRWADYPTQMHIRRYKLFVKPNFHRNTKNQLLKSDIRGSFTFHCP